MYSMSSLVSSSSNSIKYFANGTLCCDQPFYTTYQSDENNTALVLSYGEPSWETFWGETPSLGNNPNPEHYGDVEYVWWNWNILYVFVLAGNNGIGAYHAQGLATPVELTSFEAKIIGNAVNLTWETATEINNYGFEIERRNKSLNGGGDFCNWEEIGFVAGSGTTTERRNYSFKDINTPDGLVNYRIKQIDFNGSSEYSNILELEFSSPIEYFLYQNYPNPFNPGTTIKFALPEKATVELAVYNSLGEKVAEVYNGAMDEGYHEIEFRAESLSSGIYFYRLEADNFVSVKKMIIIK
jgi:hypothetical protein